MSDRVVVGLSPLAILIMLELGYSTTNITIEHRPLFVSGDHYICAVPQSVINVGDGVEVEFLCLSEMDSDKTYFHWKPMEMRHKARDVAESFKRAKTRGLLC